MANQQVAPVKTPSDSTQLIPAFIGAWRTLIGSEPSKQQIAMLLAQNALETGGFTANSMYNYNIGFIVKTPQDSFDYFLHPDTYHGKKFISKFRSYNSLEDGVLDYLKLLYKGYPQAFKATTQTPRDFAHALVANPKFQYYDDTHEHEYAAGMTALYNQALKSDSFNQTFDTTIAQPPSGNAPPVDSNDPFANLEDLLSKFVATLASYQTQQDKIYKHSIKSLPQHTFLIKVDAPTLCDAIEFSRVLSVALNEELMAHTSIYKNANNVEIECKLNGDKVVVQSLVALCHQFSLQFEQATKNIGSPKIMTYIIPNTLSNYQPLDIKLAEVNYDLFHNKILKANNGN